MVALTDQVNRACRLYSIGDIRLEKDAIVAPGPDEVLLKTGFGGICGSDLHYFQHGGIGAIRVREPIIIGHEFSGTVIETGSEVTGLKKGDNVVVNPAQTCGKCDFCINDLPIHCRDMCYIGSAARLPHTQGGFRDYITLPAQNCHKLNPDTDPSLASIAEPTAVCLHAIGKIGDLRGKKILVSGAGSIGAICALLAGNFGADFVLATDISNYPLDVLRKAGVSLCVNVTENPEKLKEFEQNKGYFDYALECSGAPAALAKAVAMVKPTGSIIQIGLATEITLPLNSMVAKEISLIGSYRFDKEFAEAVQLIDSDKFNPSPIISRIFQPEDCEEALRFAADRSCAIKTLISFNSDFTD